MVRFLTFVLFVALCFGLHGYAKRHSADYPALTRFAKTSVAQMQDAFGRGLDNGLKILDRYVADHDADDEQRIIVTPVPDAPEVSQQAPRRTPGTDELARTVLEELDRIDGLLDR